MAAKNGLLLWDFAWGGETAVPGCGRRSTGGCRSCAAAAGLPPPGEEARLALLYGPAGRRKGLLAGAVLGAALFWYLSGFVWGVTVTGTETVTWRQVRDAAANTVFPWAAPGTAEAPPGRPRHPGPDRAAELGVGQHRRLFCGGGGEGGGAAPEAETQEKWSNLVASRGGVVVSAQAERGRLEVQPRGCGGAGPAAGLRPVPVRPRPLPGPAHPPGADRGPGPGQRHRRDLPGVHRPGGEHPDPAGPFRGEGGAHLPPLFGLRLPLGLWSQPAGEFRFSQSVSAWEALGVQLPVVLERERYDPVETRQVILSREEQRDAALRALRQLQREELPQGAEILEEELRFTYTEEGCTVTARCRCWEEIGQIQEILVE